MENEKLTVLIADDEAHVRLIVKAYLAPYCVDILEARNGKEALQIISENRVDLLILDYTMPVMSGDEVLSHISRDGELADIPVIVYTAGGFDEVREVWLKRTSSAFIEKSNLGDDLIPTVKDIFGCRLRNKE